MYLSSQELQIGQFVKSKAGRDKGHVMIVVGRVDEFHVLGADGDLRKLEKLKEEKGKTFNQAWRTRCRTPIRFDGWQIDFKCMAKQEDT